MQSQRLSNLQELSELHGWSREALAEAKENAFIYEEFDSGVVILYDHFDYYVMTAFSEDDNHSLGMWRLIRSILIKYRDRPLYTSYTANREKLLKASERYNYTLMEGSLIMFPPNNQ